MTVPSSSLYDSIRASVDESQHTAQRVEVNQRALIDKILARYASAGAVYRELLQNSNDAEAAMAEIRFTVDNNKDTSSSSTVQSVMYKNSGFPFRPQDWKRLTKIAEGNPDVKKVGAFGVGAYSMFSVSEEPLIISGNTALAFLWRGDSLWTQTTKVEKESSWTTFILPSRDPYELPDLTEFGEFLCANLTFTQYLKSVRVFVNDKERLSIVKKEITPATIVQTPKTTSSSWFSSSRSASQTSTPKSLFALQSKGILESMQHITVTLDGETSSINARYVSGTAKTKISSEISKRMERVTKKKPPGEVTVHLFLNAHQDDDDDDGNSNTNSSTRKHKNNKANKIISSFSPQMGAGRVFIGFRTSQTTGLAAHLSAPLVPTVEREAIDLQEPTLKIFNLELLEFAGILLRLALEHSMSIIGQEWLENQAEREKLEKKLLEEQSVGNKKLEAQAATKNDSNGDDVSSTGDSAANKSSSSILSFAKYMAKGVKKGIVNVMNTVDTIVDDGSAELLNPRDPRPLSSEEKHAILLMRSFCPQQSTPDHVVGTALAQGFSRCLPNIAPPVLTRSGMMRGSEARLPNQGMEAFCQDNVVRTIMYRNAEEYHDVIARCRKLHIDDMARFLSAQVLDEDKIVRFFKWWTKYSRIDPRAVSRGPAMKESIRYLPKAIDDVAEVQYLKDRLYYQDMKAVPAEVPMPSSVLEKAIQDLVSERTLSDVSLKSWFMPISVEAWARFIGKHPCMSAGQPEDEKLRVTVLSILCKEYKRRSVTERVMFGSALKNILGDKRCIPFDSQELTQYAADFPSDLYLNSAELKAFEGIGAFHKVSLSLVDAGVTDDFLIALGVRKSVAIDFLFANLDTLCWKDDPKPLIEYLRSALLTPQDLQMLRTTRYLPAEDDTNRTFAPSELCLPNPELRVFPFVRKLQWPSDDELAERSANGKFLLKLGCHANPPLENLLQYISNDVKDDKVRNKCLVYLVKKLGPDGPYAAEYGKLHSSGVLSKYRILPCAKKEVFEGDEQIRIVESPLSCFSDVACMTMGFLVIDPALDKKSGSLLGTRFLCEQDPNPDNLLLQLDQLVATAQSKVDASKGELRKKLSHLVLTKFQDIFKYLSARSGEFNDRKLNSLKTKAFIPVKDDTGIRWCQPDEVYFRGSKEDEDSLTESLFHVIEFSPFLAAAGVRNEANTHDLFRLLLTSPEKVLRTLGSETKYRSLLRRIAANPPYRVVSPTIKATPFLLGYKIETSEDGEEKSTYLLAKAEDVYVIDNSFFGRMFPVIRAPHESDLEDFYVSLGSSYISKKVSTGYEVMGQQLRSTSLVEQLAERIQERRPLLVSPTVTSRPLVSSASAILDDKNLQVVETDGLKAVYTLDRSVRNQRVTCCSRSGGGKKNMLFVTDDFDWFDVGNAIGGLILQRCQLEDAFFIGSILEAPLQQLRARGFPVDRILRPPEPMKPEPVASVPPSVSENGVRESSGADAAVSTPAVASSASAAASAAASPQSGPSPDEQDEGFETILQQMFPDCQPDHIKAMLGSSPTLDDVRSIAESMATGDYPRRSPDESEDASVTTQSATASSVPDRPKPTSPLGNNKSPSKRKFGSRIGKAFDGIRASSHGGSGTKPPRTRVKSSATAAAVPPPSFSSQDGSPVPPEADKSAHSGMEQMLKNTVDRSTKVNSRGVNSAETVLTSLPEGLNRRNEGCEIIPGHSLKPFPGQYRNGKTFNGIRVFASRQHPESEVFLEENFHAVDTFAGVIENLCTKVYDLNLPSTAIFYDPSGGTIAFNANRALHFNVRFFFALHYSSQNNKQSSRECYSYWYTTMAHELAHHLVSEHNKEHGFYTESYVTLYLPKLVSLLTELDAVRK